MHALPQADRIDRVAGSANSPRAFEKIAIAQGLLKWRLREWLEHDSLLARFTFAWAGVALGVALYAVGVRLKALALLTKVHRTAASGRASVIVERKLRCPEFPVDQGRSGSGEPRAQVYRQWIQQTPCTASTSRFFRDPTTLLGSRVIVLKSPGRNERGVILLDYNFVFPLFAKLFDLEAVARRYHLVLEPGWSGYCTFDILSYTLLSSPVFVQAFEPRDAAFIGGIRSNLVSVPLATNWWVDHRILRPLPGVEKDADIIVVASWAGYKRHEYILSALNRLKRMGARPRVILIGYPMDRTAREIERLASFYGVRDQVEIYERIPLDQVNYHLNRSKVNLIWSRKEGVNRAIIEGMFAGVPCVVREGFNFGYRYPYINETTGCYSSEADLPEKLLWMIDHYSQFEPRGWVMANMTCQRSTEVLGEAIRRVGTEAGEHWTEGLAVKTAGLNGLKYWDEDDARRFESDYDFLKASIRNGGLARR
jgi:glycosyltransferase involved in cell wall biosynthesis